MYHSGSQKLLVVGQKTGFKNFREPNANICIWGGDKNCETNLGSQKQYK